MPRTALPPETRKTRARPHRRHSASSVGAAKRAPRAMWDDVVEVAEETYSRWQ